MKRLTLMLIIVMLGLSFAESVSAQACSGVVRVYHNADGSVRRMRLLCSGTCPDGDRCVKDSRGNHHGELREWCDCNRDGNEPSECHVVISSGGNGEPAILCAGGCDPTSGDECQDRVIQRINQRRGRYIEDVACECL